MEDRNFTNTDLFYLDKLINKEPSLEVKEPAIKRGDDCKYCGDLITNVRAAVRRYRNKEDISSMNRNYQDGAMVFCCSECYCAYMDEKEDTKKKIVVSEFVKGVTRNDYAREYMRTYRKRKKAHYISKDYRVKPVKSKRNRKRIDKPTQSVVN